MLETQAVNLSLEPIPGRCLVLHQVAGSTTDLSSQYPDAPPAPEVPVATPVKSLGGRGAGCHEVFVLCHNVSSWGHCYWQVRGFLSAQYLTSYLLAYWQSRCSANEWMIGEPDRNSVDCDEGEMALHIKWMLVPKSVCRTAGWAQSPEEQRRLCEGHRTFTCRWMDWLLLRFQSKCLKPECFLAVYSLYFYLFYFLVSNVHILA